MWGGGIAGLLATFAFLSATRIYAQNTTNGNGNHTGGGVGGGQGNGQGSGQDNIGNNPHIGTLAPAGTCDCIGGFCPPEAKFLRLQSIMPPSPMHPGDTATVHLVFANCSHNSDPPTNETWTDRDGYFLKAGPAVDVSLWTTSSVPLPANNPCYIAPCAVVRPGDMVAFDFTITAPMVAGPVATPANYNFGWSIRQETSTVHRYIGQTTNYNVGVEKNPTQMVDICLNPCVFAPCHIQADISGNLPAAAAIQRCIDNTEPGGTLELPLGIYLMDRQVVVDKPMTIRTAGTTGSLDGCWSPYPSITKCAVLQASGDILMQNGFFRLLNTNNVILDHVILDGNRNNRIGSTAYNECASGTDAGWNRWGFNASSFDCSDCELKYFASVNALCGTGMEWSGNPRGADRVSVHDSVFRDNGDKNTNRLWADGLTIGVSDGMNVNNNFFVDNSDVDFISGGGFGASGRQTGNTILHQRQASFAGLMLHSWDGATNLSLGAFSSLVPYCTPTPTSGCANFLNIEVSGNTIDCGAQLCGFGIEIGPRPWVPQKLCNTNDRACCVDSGPNKDISCCPLNNPDCPEGYPNIFGGLVTGNSVGGARQNINIAGAGVIIGNTSYPTTVFANTFTTASMSQLPLSQPFVTGSSTPTCDGLISTTGNINAGNSGNTPSGNVIDYRTDPPNTVNNYCPF